MARKRTDPTTRALKLNLAAVAALLAAVALVAYAATSSDGNRPRLSADMPGDGARGDIRLALPLADRQDIFIDVIAENRSGVDARAACEYIALRRDLSTDVVVRVVREGARRGWPRE